MSNLIPVDQIQTMAMSIAKSVSEVLVPIHREGYRFVAIFAGVTLVMFWLHAGPLAWAGVVLTLWCAYFFRDPERVTPLRVGLVISPADGRVSAIWGTHTHVPTADEEVFPKGTGYLTDLGMTGAVRSVLGIKPEQSVETFLGGLPGRYREPEKSAGKMQGAIFTLDDATGLCVSVERVDVR